MAKTVHFEFSGRRAGTAETRWSPAGGLQQLEMAVMGIRGTRCGELALSYESGTGIWPTAATT